MDEFIPHDFHIYLIDMSMSQTPPIKRYYPVLLVILTFLLCTGGVAAAGILTIFPGTVIVGQSSTALPGTVWKLEAYYTNNTLVAPLPDAIITLKFQDDSQITGLSGVNRYFGQYSAFGSSLAITGLGNTEMAGPAPLMRQESAYLSLLHTVSAYRVNGTTLSLIDRTGKVVLRLTRTDDFQKTTVTNPATVLPGTSWKLVSYTKGDSVVSGRDVSKITLKFSDKGNLSGFSGVNSYFATYTLTWNALRIGEIGSTKWRARTTS
jgi:heat shock protein HslJ